MTVLRDTFCDEMSSRLLATGWVVLGYHRYEPTTLVGLTPTGRTFTFALTPDGEVTITVAGRTWTRSITPGTHENGAIAVTAILDVWEQLPVNQR